MAGELLEGFGALLSLIGVVLGVIVSAGILVVLGVIVSAGILAHIGAPLWLWLLYTIEMILIVVGVVMRVIGEHL